MNKINEEELPDEETKLDMLLLAGEKLSHYGYKNYAQNFYCKNKDYLWQFLNKYQGDLDCDFIGFGPFSSSFINGIGVNSYDKMKNYYAMLDNNEFPVKIGYQYNTDDLIRNYVIHYMQANLCIKKKIIEQAYRIDFDSYFKNELIKLKIMEDDGLLTIKDDVISLTKEGKIYVTNILMVFDSYPHWKEILSVEI
jgi:oxygen-independent coproporphyrinogen-3 oxidase